MRFRLACDDDVAAVVSLVESAYRGEASRAGWTTEADLVDGGRTSPREVRQLVVTGSTLLAVGHDGGLLGCCQLERPGYFGMFAVRPTSQGAGVGSALLAEAERRAKAWGAGVLELTVISLRIDMIAWYERRGYVRTGEERPFPDGGVSRPRRDDLLLAVLAKPL